MKFVKYENFAAIKKYIWTENMSKKDQDLSLLFLGRHSLMAGLRIPFQFLEGH